VRRRPSVRAAGAALLLGLGLIGLAACDGGLAAGIGGLAAGMWQGALYLLPALLLLTPLLARRYPGERLLRARHVRRTRLRARARIAARALELAAAHGGRLIAVSLAGRAPPRPRAAVAPLS
jgi:hypothetical protein